MLKHLHQTRGNNCHTHSTVEFSWLPSFGLAFLDALFFPFILLLFPVLLLLLISLTANQSQAYSVKNISILKVLSVGWQISCCQVLLRLKNNKLIWWVWWQISCCQVLLRLKHNKLIWWTPRNQSHLKVRQLTFQAENCLNFLYFQFSFYYLDSCNR